MSLIFHLSSLSPPPNLTGGTAGESFLLCLWLLWGSHAGGSDIVSFSVCHLNATCYWESLSGIPAFTSFPICIFSAIFVLTFLSAELVLDLLMLFHFQRQYTSECLLLGWGEINGEPVPSLVGLLRSFGWPLLETGWMLDHMDHWCVLAGLFFMFITRWPFVCQYQASLV